MTFADISILAFMLLNMGRALAYGPQIVRICRDGTGASAVSITTWCLFTASNLATVTYALAQSKDAFVAAVFAFNALGCLTIAVLAMWKRSRHARASAAHACGGRDHPSHAEPACRSA